MIVPLASTQDIAEDETILSPIPNANTATDETVLVSLSSISSDKPEETLLQTETIAKPTLNKTKTAHKKPESIQVGSLIKDRFLITKALGKGGMGTVFQATDKRKEEAQDTHTDVAIKALNDEFKNDPTLFMALQREAKKTQLLAHPNIITVYDFDKDEHNNVFLVMELLEGKTLSQFIREECRDGMPFKEAWPTIKGLALALAYAHNKNIIHSDFKPGNVFITQDGNVKVLDFGIASAAVMADSGPDDDVFNARDLGALTPAYASLEMLEGKPPSPADDVYALACVCYEILSGKHPFQSDQPPYAKKSAEIACFEKLTAPTISGINRRTRLALKHALAFELEQRTATASDFLAEIEPKSLTPKVLGGITTSALLAIAVGFYYVNYEMTVVDEEMISLSAEQQQQITDLLELAEMHFEVGFLTAPSGSNAVWAYKQALVIAPYDQQALAGLKQIADIIEQQAADLYVEGKNQASLAKIEEGLSAVPKHENLLTLKEQILTAENM
ncbi:MAG: protein kinase [Methyloprofundus sp.]|nr:protein kinase [Methyloprofundus sp.]